MFVCLFVCLLFVLLLLFVVVVVAGVFVVVVVVWRGVNIGGHISSILEGEGKHWWTNFQVKFNGFHSTLTGLGHADM